MGIILNVLQATKGFVQLGRDGSTIIGSVNFIYPSPSAEFFSVLQKQYPVRYFASAFKLSITNILIPPLRKLEAPVIK